MYAQFFAGWCGAGVEWDWTRSSPALVRPACTQTGKRREGCPARTAPTPELLQHHHPAWNRASCQLPPHSSSSDLLPLPPSSSFTFRNHSDRVLDSHSLHLHISTQAESSAANEYGGTHPKELAKLGSKQSLPSRASSELCSGYSI